MAFYEYRQNNSGGTFTVNEEVTIHVIIEADNDDQANSIAEEIGIYFDGCDKGRDCSCCGDRWDRNYSEGDPEPSIYYHTPPEDFSCPWVEDGEVYCRVYFKDGTTKEYIK